MLLFYSDIDEQGNEIEEDKPSGPDSEHRQPAKTINAKAQRVRRAEKRRRKMAEQHDKAVTEYHTINDILRRNAEVENELKDRVTSGVVADATVTDFLSLKPASKLEDFIHARKFSGKTFHRSKLAGVNGKLNKTRYKGQTAESIASNCSEEEPCLVWLAWKLRSTPLALKERPMPVLNTNLPTPTFSVVYSRPTVAKLASQYLQNVKWVDSLKLTVKGVGSVAIDDDMMKNADALASALDLRIHLHIADPERVDSSRQNHWTLSFTRDNIPPMAAAMCLVGHIVRDLHTYDVSECLLVHPTDESFRIISGDLDSLEGCYLYFNRTKNRWIRSGKTSGEGEAACFSGRGKKHKQNSTLIAEMRKHRFYASYPTKGVTNLGAIKGYFDNLEMFCGMAFDVKQCVTPLCSNGADDSVFIWSTLTIDELKKKEGNLQKYQLDALSYMWELCYDLVLGKSDNVSQSPGFESFGLRVNNGSKKRKRDEE
jgi:ribosomal protein L15